MSNRVESGRPGPAPTSTLWSVAAAVVLLVVGTWAAVQAALSGADFMYDLERPVPALAREAVDDTPPHIERLSQRVVVAIVDGLRVDVSRGLPYLDELRGQGVDAVARSGYPTWSRPNYVNILTGVPPEYSGVRTNRHPTVVLLDSVMDRVRAGGMRAGYASDYSPLPKLFLRSRAVFMPVEMADMDEGTADAWRRAIRTDLAGDFDDARYAPWPGGFRDAARHVVAAGDSFAVLLIGVVDAAGHEYGGDSPEYRAAAFEADAALRAVTSTLDFERDTLIVVADHGHSDRGGHGGLEPEVVQVPLIMVGAGVVPRARLDGATLSDVAPTVTTLLALPAPGHALGRTLLPALKLNASEALRVASIDAVRVARNQRVVDGEQATARTARLKLRAWRLFVIGAASAAAIALAWWLRRRGGIHLDWRVLVVGTPAFFLVYYTLIGTLGQRFSPSFLPEQGHIGWELLKFGLIGAAVHLVVGWLALRGRKTLADRLAAANGIAWLGLVVAMVPAGLLWALFPAPYVEVPGPRLLILIPAVKVAIACYAFAIPLSLLIEVVVFFSRAVDPRARVKQLERAMEKARSQVERDERGRR